jgi:hypothetical protein
MTRRLALPPLDKRYGKGAAAAFAAIVDLTTAFPGSTAAITEDPGEDGTLRVEVIWTSNLGARIGVYKLDYYPRHVHCADLSIEPAFRAKGLLIHLMVGLEPWWTSVGLLRNTMSVAPGSLGEKALRSAGFRELPNGDWGTPLPATRCREFIDWVLAGKLAATEPAWRKALGPAVDVF